MNVGRTRLGIPKPPREVRFAQVPGAVRRLCIVAGVAFVACGGILTLSLWAGRWLSTEREFLEGAQDVEARVSEIRLPKGPDRERGDATVTVLYEWNGAARSVTGVSMITSDAESIGPGARVTLLVNPKAPERPREKRAALLRAGFTRFLPGGVMLGLLTAVLLIARELRRAFRRELDPLRKGMLVWLTPDEDLPRTRGELQFRAHYFQDDVKHEVKARARPGRAPVRNAEKLLAAVVPTQPTWVRVIDDDLARELGWYQPG